MSVNPGDLQAATGIRADQLSVTESAGNKMAELLAGADEDMQAVRVFVSGGGCGGMNYGMTFTDARGESDSVYEGNGFRLFIDPIALSYMEGAEIDYQDDGVNATFVFNNVFQAVGGSGACAGCAGGGY